MLYILNLYSAICLLIKLERKNSLNFVSTELSSHEHRRFSFLHSFLILTSLCTKAEEPQTCRMNSKLFFSRLLIIWSKCSISKLSFHCFYSNQNDPKIRHGVQDPLLHSAAMLVPKLLLWGRRWHPIPVLLPGKSHGRRSLAGCSPWDH